MPHTPAFQRLIDEFELEFRQTGAFALDDPRLTEIITTSGGIEAFEVALLATHSLRHFSYRSPISARLLPALSNALLGHFNREDPNSITQLTLHGVQLNEAELDAFAVLAEERALLVSWREQLHSDDIDITAYHPAYRAHTPSSNQNTPPTQLLEESLGPEQMVPRSPISPSLLSPERPEFMIPTQSPPGSVGDVPRTPSSQSYSQTLAQERSSPSSHSFTQR